MKNLWTIVNVVLVCVLILILAVFVMPGFKAQFAPPEGVARAAEPVCNTGRSVQVSGTAVVNVTPDRVLIQLGVQSNGVTPQSVENANSTTINKVTRAMAALGIEEKDMVTDWYIIEPVYDDYSSLYIKGYRIYNIVAITLRDIGKVNQVIVAALNAGANQVVNVEFYLSDLRTYRDQARQLAMEAAQEKAQDLASAAGAETGCVMNINENTWSYYNGGWYAQNRDLWTQNTIQNVAPSAGDSGALSDAGPVNLGQISVRAEVSASFSLK